VVIIESSVWIDYFRNVENPQTKWLERSGRRKIGLMDLSLCEVLQGTTSAALFVSIRDQLIQLPVLSSDGTWTMLAAAENYRKLRDRGRTVRSTIDCIIATYCIQHGHELLHNDRDFDGFEKYLGLRVVHP
jgi:predicted nucleic acid-binding protein